VGADCEYVVNQCVSNPCVNGATCFNGLNSFACLCKQGYNGTLCQNSISLCNSSVCLNGGTCVNKVNQTSCTCAKGYGGTNCHQILNSCLPNPCLNGGTCTPGVNATQFNCSCVPNFNGTTCNTANNKIPVTDFSVVGYFELSNLNFTYANTSSTTQNQFKSAFRQYLNETFQIPLETVYVAAIGKVTGGIKTNFSIDTIALSPTRNLDQELALFILESNSTSFSEFNSTLVLYSAHFVTHLNSTINLNQTTASVNYSNPKQLTVNQATGIAVAVCFIAAIVFGGLAYLNNRCMGTK